LRDASDITVGELESVLANRRGDPIKLQSIIDTMKKGIELNDSDKEFIQKLVTPTGSPARTFPASTFPEKIFDNLVITTTPSIEGSKITEYLGIVSGQAIMGGNVFRDTIASVSDAFGGRSGVYETKFREAREHAFYDLALQAKRNGANAIVGVKIDHEMVRNDMMSVSVHGTAVKIVKEKKEVKSSKKN